MHTQSTYSVPSRNNFFRKIHRFIAILETSRWISLMGPLKEINVSVWTYLSTVIDLTIRIVCDERWRFNQPFSHWVPVCHSVNTAVRCKCFTTGGTSFLPCILISLSSQIMGEWLWKSRMNVLKNKNNNKIKYCMNLVEIKQFSYKMISIFMGMLERH